MSDRLTVRPSPQTDIPDSFAPDPVGQDHDQIEAMIPMRDGVRLYTLVLIPHGAPRPSPMLLTRTPYGVRDEARTLYPSPILAAGQVRRGEHLRPDRHARRPEGQTRPSNKLLPIASLSTLILAQLAAPQPDAACL